MHEVLLCVQLLVAAHLVDVLISPCHLILLSKMNQKAFFISCAVFACLRDVSSGNFLIIKN